MKKHKKKLALSPNTIRNLTSLALHNVMGGDDDGSANGTCHCASQKAHSGCINKCRDGG